MNLVVRSDLGRDMRKDLAHRGGIHQAHPSYFGAF
jgi:hypothetical protein